MAVSPIKKKCAYFDTKGQELPWGRYESISPFYNGWSLVGTHVGKEMFDGLWEWEFINEQGEHRCDLHHVELCEHWSRDLTVCCSDESGVFGLRNLQDGRMVLPLGKSCRLYSQNFAMNNGKWLHIETNGKFYRADGNGEIVNELGPVKTWRCSMYAVLPADEGPDNFLEADEEPNWFFDCDKKIPVYIRSGVDGAVSRPFWRVGPQVEGLRYVQELDGTEHFVNGAYEPVLELPYPTGVAELSGGNGSHVESWYSMDGFITMNRWKRKGGKTAYLMDREGNIVIPPGKFADMIHVGCGRLLVRKGNKMALADLQGNLLTDYDYSCMSSPGFEDYSRRFSYGLLPMVKKVGARHAMCAINPQGEEVFPPVFEELAVHSFSWKSQICVDSEENVFPPIVVARYL